MTEPRTIAVVRAHEGYRGIVDAFRARADALDVSRIALDEIAGLPERYVQKLLAMHPHKVLGPNSWGPLLGATGMAIIFVEDTDALAQIQGRLQPRDNKSRRVLTDASRAPQVSLITPLTARGMVAARNAKLTPEQRSAIAKKAIRARWKKWREKQPKWKQRMLARKAARRRRREAMQVAGASDE